MKIHFIGIGGIGISGIAFVLSKKGNKTQGSDAVGSEITKQLQEQGIDVFIGHKKEYITKNIDLVIYSEAIQKNNVELKQAKKLNIKCQTGAQALAELSKNYFTIAVSGMHGKTTTASMLAKILTDVGLDPTYIIGAKNSWRLGKSKYLIIEADDFQAKFLNYQPDILVLTNVEEEHMDYFKDLSHILKVFKQYISQVKQIIIANQNDKNIKKAIKSAKCPTRYYKPQNLELKAPGLHNQYNAAAALKTALALGIGEGSAKKSLRGFQGAWRRFEEKKIIVNKSSIIIISDYAHHPTEIAAVLKTETKLLNK